MVTKSIQTGARILTWSCINPVKIRNCYSKVETLQPQTQTPSPMRQEHK